MKKISKHTISKNEKKNIMKNILEKLKNNQKNYPRNIQKQKLIKIKKSHKEASNLKIKHELNIKLKNMKKYIFENSPISKITTQNQKNKINMSCMEPLIKNLGNILELNWKY